MKKLVLLSMVLMNSYMLFSNETGETYFVSNDGRINCQKISLGIFRARVVLTTGEKVKIPINDIDSYSLNGKLFRKLNVYHFSQYYSSSKFMEQVAERDGFYLYKLTEYIYDGQSHGNADFYYVYKGDKFTSPVTQKNCRLVFQYFGVKADKVYVVY